MRSDLRDIESKNSDLSYSSTHITMTMKHKNFTNIFMMIQKSNNWEKFTVYTPTDTQYHQHLQIPHSNGIFRFSRIF